MIQIELSTVIDKRLLGFRCTNCGNFRKEPLAFSEGDKIIFKPNEIWIVKNHYDGCDGWD